MKVVAINGSHRKGMNTAAMLGLVLEEAARGGAETELVELVDCRIEYCLSCNQCLREPKCSIRDDDMPALAEKMLAADAVILGSPVYFGNVTARLKTFMDRTRWLHMRKNLLEGKLGAALTHAGLRNGGQEMTQMILERFLLSHGFQLVEPREPGRPIYNSAVMGTLFDGLDGDRFRWRKGVLEDALAVAMCRALGRNLLRRATTGRERAELP
uniref:Flavodoxin family protein n=1 Tax=Desulfacinum infernum TaxID=35837 RepID=A0A831ZTC5_9BACT